MMNNPAEPVPSSSVSDIILSDTNSGFINQMIVDGIPADVWKKLETTAIANGYTAQDCLMPKQSIIPKIMNVVHSFWDHIEDYERQGYKLIAFNLQIEFKSTAAQTNINFDILTNATHRRVSIVKTAITDNEPVLEKTTTNYPIENISLIIDDVRTGKISKDFPGVSLLEEELEKNPNWTGDNLSELSTSKSVLHLFQLNIKPTLFFESIRPDFSARLTDNQTNLTISQPNTEIQKETPSFRRNISGESGMEMSLFRSGIHLKYKKKQPAPSDIQSELQSLSMNGSSSDI